MLVYQGFNIKPKERQLKMTIKQKLKDLQEMKIYLTKDIEAKKHVILNKRYIAQMIETRIDIMLLKYNDDISQGDKAIKQLYQMNELTVFYRQSLVKVDRGQPYRHTQLLRASRCTVHFYSRQELEQS